MENKPVTVEPVLCSDRQRDVSSNHAEIQVSRRRKAQDTVQFQSADANHDLEKSLQNLEVVEHVEGKTTENNHDQREESQNLHAHEINGQEIGATGGYSAFSRVQPEEADDLQLPEIQESQRRKAQDTVQFQSADSNHDLEKSLEVVEHVEGESADTNHDLENRLQNLEVVDHVEGETTENNHDQGEESQNLHAHEINGQEIGATGYSAFSGVQLEEPDDLQLPGMLTDQVFSDGVFNTCAYDTILSIETILQLKVGPIHDFYKNSKHHIYKLNSHLPQLVREGRLPEMRSHIDFYKDPEKDYAVDINYLLERRYVIKEDYYEYCASCYTSKSWTEVVNFKDFRPENEDDGRNCIPDEMLKDPPKFFDEILRPYLKCFYLHNDSFYNHGIVAYCTNCMRKRRINCQVEYSDGNPAPLFLVMLPIKGSTKKGNVIVEKIVKDVPPLCCYNYKYVIGAVIVFIDDPIGSETSSNCSDSQEEQRPGIIADKDHEDEEPIGHYIGHVYIVNPESGKVIKKYRYCNIKGTKEIREFEEEGDCVTFLLCRIE